MHLYVELYLFSHQYYFYRFSLYTWFLQYKFISETPFTAQKYDFVHVYYDSNVRKTTIKTYPSTLQNILCQIIKKPSGKLQHYTDTQCVVNLIVRSK